MYKLKKITRKTVTGKRTNYFFKNGKRISKDKFIRLNKTKKLEKFIVSNNNISNFFRMGFFGAYQNVIFGFQIVKINKAGICRDNF